jgi:hypothetical protein
LPEENVWFDGFDCIIYWTDDADDLDALLMRHIEADGRRLVIPQLPGRGLDRSLFLISIPKAGTHLLSELVQTLGFYAGQEFSWLPRKGAWHYLEFSNAHTKAPDFFADSVRRQPLGNRFHPFAYSAALFMYRHPYDILLSEANYNHTPGSTLFSGYLDQLNLEERLARLAADTLLLGTLRDRILPFVPWLDFSNVIPLSFEELIGERGGGDAALQRRAVWSVMLKLHLAGNVGEICARIFNPHSVTFHKGQIGKHKEHFTANLWDMLHAQAHDYLDMLGYAHTPSASPYSARIGEFCRRPLRVKKNRNFDVPILLESGYLGWNIVLFRENFYAVRLGYQVNWQTVEADVKTDAHALLASDGFEKLKAQVTGLMFVKRMRSEEPLLLESGYLGWNIVLFRENFYAARQGYPVNWLTVEADVKTDTRDLLVSDDFESLKTQVTKIRS